MPKTQAPSLMGRALRFLSRRERGRQELRKKLLVYAESADEVDELLVKLEKQAWLSDERYAESLARRKSDRYGSLKIIDELKQQSVDVQTIGKIKEELKQSDLARAWALWDRKFSGVPAIEPKERAKQMKYLVGKGFPLDVVSKVVSGRFRPNQEPSI